MACHGFDLEYERFHNFDNFDSMEQPEVRESSLRAANLCRLVDPAVALNLSALVYLAGVAGFHSSHSRYSGCSSSFNHKMCNPAVLFLSPSMR